MKTLGKDFLVAGGVALLIFLGACTTIYTRDGAYTRVQKNDTLASIAQRYKIDIQELAESNNIEDPESLKVGQALYIPGAKPSSFAKIIEREGGFQKRSLGLKRPKKGRRETELAGPVIETDHGKFQWPIVGDLSSLFGVRRGRRHDGIDIRARQGTPIMAAAPGEVVFAKRMRGYGNLVLVKHSDDFFTVYAHNSVNSVKQGKKVKQGEVIAKVGKTGRATGPHLHFEVREGTTARNPLFFLPKNEQSKVAQKDLEVHPETGGSYGGSGEETEDDHP